MAKSYFQNLFDAHEKVMKLELPLGVPEKICILEGLKGTLGATDEIERFLECEKLRKQMSDKGN